MSLRRRITNSQVHSDDSCLNEASVPNVLTMVSCTSSYCGGHRGHPVAGKAEHFVAVAAQSQVGLRRGRSSRSGGRKHKTYNRLVPE